MAEQNNPREDNPKTSDSEDVSGYAYRPGPPPVSEPKLGSAPMPAPSPVPPGIVPPADPTSSDYEQGSDADYNPPVNRDGGPDGVSGYMMNPLPVNDFAPPNEPPPPGPDPYEKDPAEKDPTAPPDPRVPPGIPDANS
jgi:hypothetical protein